MRKTLLSLAVAALTLGQAAAETKTLTVKMSDLTRVSSGSGYGLYTKADTESGITIKGYLTNASGNIGLSKAGDKGNWICIANNENNAVIATVEFKEVKTGNKNNTTLVIYGNDESFSISDETKSYTDDKIGSNKGLYTCTNSVDATDKSFTIDDKYFVAYNSTKTGQITFSSMVITYDLSEQAPDALGAISGKFGETSVSNNGAYSVETDTKFSFTAENATSMSVKYGEGEATTAEGSSIEWTATTPGEEAEMVVTAAKGEETKTLTFKLTVLDPNRPGTANNPFTVAQALENCATTESDEVYVKGNVTKVEKWTSAKYINYYIADAAGDVNTLMVYRGTWIDGADITAENQPKLGAEVVLKGKLQNYNGTKEIKNSSIVEYTAPEMEKVAYPEFDPASGTRLYAEDVVRLGCTTEGATIHYAVNAGDEPEYSVYTDGGISFTADGTYTIVAYAAKEGMTDSDKVTATFIYAVKAPVTAEFDFANADSFPTLDVKPANGNEVTDNVLNGFEYTANGVTLAISKGEGELDPRWWNSSDVYNARIYQNNTLTVSVSGEYAAIASIEFVQGKGSTTWNGFTCEPASAVALDADNKNMEWTPSSEVAYEEAGSELIKSVKFTAKKANHFQKIVVKYEDKTPTGIAAVEAENGEAIYFNMQGVRVANPDKGIFIRVQNGKATKILK